MLSRISLEQWRMFIAVVEHGGFVQAASHLNKTQSAVSHAIKKMESSLGQTAFLIEGRKAVLTELGRTLLPKAKHLLGEAIKLEQFAARYQPGVVSELAIAVDVLFPDSLLYDALARFSETATHTRIRLYETSLSGTRELLEDGKVDFGIASTMPVNHVVENLLAVPLICVAAPEHPLFQLGKRINRDVLSNYRQIVIRDSGVRASQNTGWLGASQRWTVTHSATVVRMLERGFGFAWVPESCVAACIEAGRLKILPLTHGQQRTVALSMGYPSRENDDPAMFTMREILRELCGQEEKTGVTN